MSKNRRALCVLFKITPSLRNLISYALLNCRRRYIYMAVTIIYLHVHVHLFRSRLKARAPPTETGPSSRAGRKSCVFERNYTSFRYDRASIITIIIMIIIFIYGNNSGFNKIKYVDGSDISDNSYTQFWK